MSRHDPPPSGLGLRLLLIGATISAMLALIVALERTPARAVAESPTDAVLTEAARVPIAAEARVFLAWRDFVPYDPDVTRRSSAHPRTLATFRRLRAYPGAPPRVPHGLTGEEFRTNRCNTCHERGGYSLRFNAYAPMTPHPELGSCLQCHATDAGVVGLALPGADRAAVCRQCHLSGAVPRAPGVSGLELLDWRTLPWPEIGTRALDGAPPPIPHDQHFRENCLACHFGSGAVAEIRTRHAARTNCRQCHVTADPEAGVYVRPAVASRAPARGVP
ncbi:MAG TPA: hypothetical protein VLE53_05560 [Gemmatimonadaceae bacterium]|nr:hypothetical protein [Gemmatimonadaceae bacterium]